MGVVFEAESFLFEDVSIDFDLGFIFSEDFEEYAVISFEEAIDLNGGLFGGISEFGVVVIFAIAGTEDFIGSASDGFMTYFAFSFHGEFWFRDKYTLSVYNR